MTACFEAEALGDAGQLSISNRQKHSSHTFPEVLQVHPQQRLERDLPQLLFQEAPAEAGTKLELFKASPFVQSFSTARPKKAKHQAERIPRLKLWWTDYRWIHHGFHWSDIVLIKDLADDEEDDIVTKRLWQFYWGAWDPEVLRHLVSQTLLLYQTAKATEVLQSHLQLGEGGLLWAGLDSMRFTSMARCCRCRPHASPPKKQLNVVSRPWTYALFMFVLRTLTEEAQAGL